MPDLTLILRWKDEFWLTLLDGGTGYDALNKFWMREFGREFPVRDEAHRDSLRSMRIRDAKDKELIRFWRTDEIAPIADGATGEEPMETNGQPSDGGHQSHVNLPEDAWAAKT